VIFLFAIGTLIAFALLDLLIRVVYRKLDAAKVRKARERALSIGLKLDFTHEALSLKRVAVEKPRARILAVDDEAVVLDSLRRILVFEGYSIDTVENGREALGLIQKNDYDFVFTDLKMPGMDGIEVVKGVKHLRSDLDVIIITGFATVETAVDAMKFGAMDYVQKPFTDDELSEWVSGFVIRRNNRIEVQGRATVRLVTATVGYSDSRREFNVPAGLFIGPNHTWLGIEKSGEVRIGLDDFAGKIIGKIDGIDLPSIGREVRKGDVLFSISQGNRRAEVTAPVCGRVTAVNEGLREQIDWVNTMPFDLGWVCRIDGTTLHQELLHMKIGADSVDWYQKEIERFQSLLKEMDGNRQAQPGKRIEERTTEETNHPEYMDHLTWNAFCRAFLMT
jgi:CheY-like chemotaxis protein